MAANPISYAEIDAYCRLVWGELTAWEVKTILSIDRATRGLAMAKSKTPEARTEVDVSDGAGVGALLRGMGAKKG